jgi:hypothetical protein
MRHSYISHGKATANPDDAGALSSAACRKRAGSNKAAKRDGEPRYGNRGLCWNTRKHVLGLSFILGAATIFGVSPSVAKIYANTYDVDVANGTNPAHAGTWTVKVSYDSTSQTVSFTVLTPPADPDDPKQPKSGQGSWNNWTWTVPATPSGSTVTFNGTSGTPTKPARQRGMTPNSGDVLTFADRVPPRGVGPTAWPS